MKRNQNSGCERMERLQFCDWFSRTNQERYWIGSPWRALRDIMR